MDFISVTQFAQKYSVSERTVRNYCAAGKIQAAIVPFIITDNMRLYYYRGIQNWGHINGYLTDTCLSAQDEYKAILDYFKIK